MIPELMHDWIMVWCCVLLRKYGQVGPEPTVKGCLTVAGTFLGIYYWLNIVTANSRSYQ